MREIHSTDAILKNLLPSQNVKQGITYIPSQFALPFTHKNTDYVFHTLTKQCLQGTLPQQATAGSGWDELIREYFLVPQEQDQCAFYENLSKLVRAFYAPQGHTVYVIEPTLACNARCIYCYEAGRKQTAMTPETMEKTLQYILKTRDKNKGVYISWFGGEPLLGERVMDYISEGLKRAEVQYSSSIISNGSLIDERVADKMRDLWQVKRAQISMDGAEADYIYRKNYYHYQNTYDQVINAVNLLAARDIRVSIRCNIDDENFDGIPQFLQDLSARIADKQKVSIYFAMLFQKAQSEDNIALKEKMHTLEPLVKQAGFATGKALNNSMLRFKKYYCAADGNGVTIGPDGALYACQHCHDAARFGDVEHGMTDEAQYKAFTRTDRTKEKCRKCVFLPICTSFSECPDLPANCKEWLMVDAMHMLKKLVDEKEAEGEQEEQKAESSEEELQMDC